MANLSSPPPSWGVRRSTPSQDREVEGGRRDFPPGLIMVDEQFWTIIRWMLRLGVVTNSGAGLLAVYWGIPEMLILTALTVISIFYLLSILPK